MRVRHSLLFVALLCVACASGGGGGRPRSGNPSLLTEDELHEPSVAQMNLYDAVNRLRPNWLRARGASSLSAGGDVFPKAIVDNVAQSLDLLKSIKALEVLEAQYVSATEATTRYGTGYPNGAIVVMIRRR